MIHSLTLLFIHVLSVLKNMQRSQVARYSSLARDKNQTREQSLQVTLLDSPLLSYSILFCSIIFFVFTCILTSLYSGVIIIIKITSSFLELQKALGIEFFVALEICSIHTNAVRRKRIIWRRGHVCTSKSCCKRLGWYLSILSTFFTSESQLHESS